MKKQNLIILAALFYAFLSWIYFPISFGFGIVFLSLCWIAIEKKHRKTNKIIIPLFAHAFAIFLSLAMTPGFPGLVPFIAFTTLHLLISLVFYEDFWIKIGKKIRPSLIKGLTIISGSAIFLTYFSLHCFTYSYAVLEGKGSNFEIIPAVCKALNMPWNTFYCRSRCGFSHLSLYGDIAVFIIFPLALSICFILIGLSHSNRRKK